MAILIQILFTLFFMKLSFDTGFKNGYTSVRFDIERHDYKMRQCIEVLAQGNSK